MASREETYIVRVRPDEGDAVVEEVRSGRRSYVPDLAALEALIASGFWRRMDAVPDAADRTGGGEE
jgi:hypothetical protein